MTDLRINASVAVDGRGASAELRKLAGDIGQTKVAMTEAQAASRAAAAALKAHAAAADADAAEQLKLRDALVAARTAEALATREHALAAAAMTAHGRAAQNLGVSAGQARASMTNLGQQIGDVSMGLSLGVAPATIFAQQAGQVAFALSGMGGAARGAGAFLGGPWGIALTTALVALSPFAGKLFETGDAARVAKDGSISFAREVTIVLGGLADVAGRVFDPLVTGLDRAIERVTQRLPSFADLVTRGLGVVDGAAGTSFAAGYKRTRAREIDRARTNDDLDSIYKIIDDVNKGQPAREAAQSAIDGRKREAAAAARAAREEYGRLAEAFNPLLAAQLEYRKNLDDIARAEARGIASAGQAADARAAAEAKLRQARLAALGAEASAPARLAVGAGDLTAGLAARLREGDDARELDAVVAGIGRDLGLTTARDFGRAALEFSQVIGNGIAGGFGRALQRSTAVAALVDRLAPGQGRIVGAVSEQVLRDAFRPITAALEKLFGADGALAKGLGRVLGGAAAGGATADLAGRLGIGLSRAGAEIGGAIGGTKAAAKALEKVMKGLGDFAPLIGGLVGGIAGKLLGPRNPFADVALATTAAGVSGSVFNQRGEGSAARGNTLASAVQDQLARLASALGADIRPGQSLGAIGFSGDQYFFNRTGGDFKAAGNERFGSAEEAVAAAVANALATGAIATSPRVQAALSRYAGNVNTAVAEALKVRDLEALIEAQGNPFIAAFRDFERQARQRLDVARQHGFELIAIERLNADQRSALIRETLERATGSARALLDDFRFGDRAGGSVRDRLGALGAERDRLAGLVRGGDTGQLDALASVIRQIDDAQREAFGSTGEAASGRASSAALLQELVDATEARVRAASDEARRAQAEQLATQRSMDATLEDIFQTGRQQLAALDAIAAGLRPAGGAYDFALASGAAR